MAHSQAQHSFAHALDLHRAGRLEEAAALYRAFAGDASPWSVDARINLGAILDGEGRHEEALLAYREALAERPEDPVALNNMGNSLMALGRFAEAADCFRDALHGAPECREALIALGAALQREGELPAAVACFREAIRRAPDCAESHYNLGLALLQAGEFAEGWREYQWRWARDTFTSPRRAFHQPLWDGSPLAGRRILVHGEQGLGDTIQFLRYLPMVAAAGGTVLAECQSASLIPLVERVPGVAGAFVMGEPLPPFDLQIPLLSLPYIFGTALDSIPAGVPYLEPPPERVEAWQGLLPGSDCFRVGVAWQGKQVPDPFRSCPLAALAPLAGIPGLELHSLQVGEGAAQALHPPRGLELVDHSSAIRDFADTAALVAGLDLVISIDTSVAHLAGALGKPVWLLLPRAADWRWLSGREDSPWYPGMRLFRQVQQGQWGEVIERLAGELRRAVGEYLERWAAREPFNGRRSYLYGQYLVAEGRHYEAALRFNKAALLIPGSWEVHYNLAATLQIMGRTADAEPSLLQALALRDDLAFLHEALGVVRQMQGDLTGAVSCYRNALALDPAAQKSRYNLATALQEGGQHREALDAFREVLERDPAHADAHWNLAVLLLMTGRLAEGWREFPWRFKKKGIIPAARWQDRPRWDGCRADGLTVLLYGEQGLGDTLQFVRYAPLVAARGARVLVEVQSESLVTLVARVPGVSGVIVAGEEPPPFDLQASLMELPALFNTELDSIPAQVSYLQADPARAAASRALVPRDGTLRVGLVWSGCRAHQNDANRSLPLERLAGLAGVPGVTFYSLQTGDAAGDAAGVPGLGLVDLSGALADFSDTAAIAAELDLVLTVDTSVAHLAGGLGVPVWVMIPYIPDWRWLLEREDSPWYPTLRLFRQSAPGDWDGVVGRVRAALAGAAAAAGNRAQGTVGLPAGSNPSPEHRSRGIALSEQGRFAEAAREFQRALAREPHDPELLNNLGCALDSAGRHLDAVQAYRQALELDPGFCAPHYNMGNSLCALGRTAEAVECYRRALELHPALPQGWHNLGLSLQRLGHYDDALAALERALELEPGYLEASHNLGELHHARGELARAEERFRLILAENPRYLPSWNALGIALQAQERPEEALQCYQQALSLDPDYLHALNNLGAASRALGDLERAAGCYRAVIARDPDYADAHWNLALVQLQLGDYREGWQGYEWRFRKDDPIPLKDFPRPLWDGSRLDGRTILIHAEQGFGDTFQFVRYAALLAGMGGQVLVQCQSKVMARVLETVPGVSRVLVRGEELPEFDCHAPLMSLPLLLGTTLETVPAQIPYLRPDDELVETWRGRMSEGPGLRVGLVWAGRKTYKDDGKRSLSLPLFAPLAAVPGVRFFALQVGDGADQVASPPAGMELTDLGSGVRDFSDSAAIIAGLDLVISADTAVAHLAGALGKPVWVLLPRACDWRWLTSREDSPWYPSARLFRQTRRGEWAEVLERVAGQLALLAGSAGPAGPGGPSGPSPDNVESLTLAGVLAHQQGDSQGALQLFSRAAALNPALPELHNNLGVTLQDLGRPEEALACYRQALALKPAYHEASCNLANALRSLGRSTEALEQYRSAIALDPGYPDSYYNLGNALRAEGDWQQAVECYRTLLRLAPDHLSGWLNLGGSLIALNRFEEAILAERRALELAPDCSDAHWNLGLALLATGDYRNGWREYQWRLQDTRTFPSTCAGRPMWDGSPLDGRTLLVRSEQGFGDAFQFYRYAQLLARQGEQVVFECRPELFPLLITQDDGVQLLRAGDEPPHFDTFVYLMSLPHLLGTTLDDLPAAPAYLQADPALSRQWQGRLGEHQGLRVGIVWAGSAGYRNDRYRSLKLAQLIQLSRIPGIQLCSLQLGGAAAELADHPDAGIVDLAPGLRSFADTAAVIANLDLVVSVDTAVAHLAGALGKPVCLLLPSFSDWRWLSGRSDSPWYPTLRLYRQGQPGEWEPVLARLVHDLTRTSREQAPHAVDLNGEFRTANALRCQGRTGEAIAAYRELIALFPDCAELHNNLGLALQDEARLPEAAGSYREAVRLKPELADAHNNLGTVLVSQGDREAAVSCFRAALSLRDDYLAAYINLGCALQRLERTEEALPLYLRALEIQPQSLETLINLGTAYQELMQPELALESYQKALSLDPGCAKAHWNRALTLLSLGDFEAGWREYEWRFAADLPELVPGPRWDGAPLGGRSILLWCEQGLGDTLQFVRYAPLVAARGGHVLLRCQSAALKPLLERVPGVAAVFAPGEELPGFDTHAPLLSLPHLFETRLDHLPAPVPYLFADPERAALWRSWLAGEERLKVGLVWQGGPLPKNRACPFGSLAALAKLPGIAFFSLQLGAAPDTGLLPARDLAPEIHDFADSAAIIANLDLVLSVDTACAHLAGGLGVPVWLMLPYSCDWRWLPEQSPSPWYPSLRIFRQQRPGDWGGVLSRVARSLHDLSFSG